MIEVVGGILFREGRLLLGLRSPHKSYPGCWDFFGGHLEAGESPWQALCRELLEELDLTMVAGAPLSVVRFDRASEGPSLLHVFRVDAWNGEPRVADDEHTALRWFTSQEAQALSNLPAPEHRSLFAGLGLPTDRR